MSRDKVLILGKISSEINRDNNVGQVIHKTR